MMITEQDIIEILESYNYKINVNYEEFAKTIIDKIYGKEGMTLTEFLKRKEAGLIVNDW